MRLTTGLKATGNIVQETPQDFFDWLNSIFRFDLDVCALPENAKCGRYFTPETDGLGQDWMGGGYGAILHTEKKSSGGSRRLRRNTRNLIAASSSCFSPRGRIRDGFRSTSTTRLSFGSWTEDSSSEEARQARLFRAWSRFISSESNMRVNT